LRLHENFLIQCEGKKDVELIQRINPLCSLFSKNSKEKGKKEKQN